MKIILFLTAVFLNLSYTYCQRPYKFTLQGPYDEVPQKAIELANGELLVSYVSNYEKEFASQSLLLLDPNGNLDNMVEFDTPSTNYYIVDMLQTNDSTILCIGKMEYAGQNAEIIIMNIKPDLQVRWQKKHSINYAFVKFISATINLNGNLSIAISAGDVVNLYPLFGLFLELNTNGELIRTSYLQTKSIMNLLFDIVQDKYSGNYEIPILGLEEYVDNHSIGQLLTVDTAYQIVNVEILPHELYNCCTIDQLPDSTYILCGTREHGLICDISLIRYNRENEVLNFLDIGQPANIKDYGGLRQSMDFKCNSSMYIAGTSNIDVYTDFSWDSSWYIVSSLDSALSPKWTKYYGGDAYYRLDGVTATKDKGCVLWGTRYDYRTQTEERDLLLLKITEQGVVTDLDDHETTKAHDAIVYPNPGSNVLQVKSGPQIAGAAFILYDMTDKAVRSRALKNQITKIDTSDLPVGTYAWNILHHGKLIETGKWVKQ